MMVLEAVGRVTVAVETAVLVRREVGVGVVKMEEVEGWCKMPSGLGSWVGPVETVEDLVLANGFRTFVAVSPLRRRTYSSNG